MLARRNTNPLQETVCAQGLRNSKVSELKLFTAPIKVALFVFTRLVCNGFNHCQQED